MVKIRLSKLGKKNDHFYRIVAIDEQSKNNGRALDILGYWYPKRDEKTLDKEKLAAWVAKGAQVSATVAKLAA